ncbi:MAG: NAD(P)-binding domain-containing protein [Leifsonia sp.]
MTTVSIIGSGNMGTAIGGLVTDGGNVVEFIERSGSSITGDVVVLAVPHAALDDVLATYGDQLSGKVVVDITNPVDFASFDGLVVPAQSSAAAEIAAIVPSAKVLKAFNTTFGATLAKKKVGDAPTTVLIAGDDEDAKALLAAVVSAGGIKAIDAGGLKRARELEAIGFLQITLAATEKIGWTDGFAVIS